ncbi:MAG TPA: DsbA family oxidoreductase [Arenibaculum sp.]|nr:DsbA family oxidoreductase [Arenibaculum sp.]
MLVEIYSDLICPWCFIGKRRLERALAQRPRLVVDRRWRPFELNPDMQPAGMDRMAYLAAKFGGIERARQVYAVVEETAARDGLNLSLNRIRRTPNTLDAHRLVRYAARWDLADTLTDRLFDAYFIGGLDIGDHDVLAVKAVEAGLEEDHVRSFLDSDDETAVVRTAEATARQMGIQAVPCFVFNRRFALSGAQEPAAFLPLLDLAVDEQPVLGTV